MRKGQSSRGFTILETLIVVAIMSGLFLLFFVNFTATEKNLTFKTSMFDLQQAIQSIINKASNADYRGENLVCAVNPFSSIGPPVVTFVSAGSTGQGSNQNCEYVGVGIDFRRSVGISAYPLVVYKPANFEPLYDLKSYPVAALDNTAPGTGGSDHSYNDLEPGGGVGGPYDLNYDITMHDYSYTYRTEGGLKIDSGSIGAITDPVLDKTTTTYPNYTFPWIIAVAFSPLSGASTNSAISMAPYTVASPTTHDYTLGTYLPETGNSAYGGDYFYGAVLNQAKSVSLCFDSGSNNQSAMLQINPAAASTSSGIEVSTKIFTNPSCV